MRLMQRLFPIACVVLASGSGLASAEPQLHVRLVPEMEFPAVGAVVPVTVYVEFAGLSEASVFAPLVAFAGQVRVNGADAALGRIDFVGPSGLLLIDDESDAAAGKIAFVFGGGNPVQFVSDGSFAIATFEYLVTSTGPQELCLAQEEGEPIAALLGATPWFFWTDLPEPAGPSDAPAFTTCAVFGPLTPCPADWDESGSVSVDDLLAFLGGFRGGCDATDCAADFDADGDADVEDLLGFLGAFRSGC